MLPATSGAAFALAVSLPTLAEIPWSFVMAFASLSLIYYLFRRRADVFADFGFSGKEVALLALGSMAGWAVNIPLAVYGGTYLAVNVGGTLVPLLLIGWWIRQGKLPLLPALVGTALVTFTAWRIVEFHPDTGIVARYPTFFLPVVVALLFALAVSFRKPVLGVPIAYASGTLGALIGADLLHVADIRRHFQTAPENTIISIGGAGVFDMVFLAGTFAMALHLAFVISLRRHAPAAPAATAEYPTVPLTLRDSRRVYETFSRLQNPNALERALAGVALSNLALRDGDYSRSVRMSWLAVNSLLEAGPLEAYRGDAAPGPIAGDVRLLHERSVGTRQQEATLRDAGEANTTAKMLLAALAPHAGLRHQLEGVA